MTSASELAKLAGLLADESRAAMCLALLDGRAWTAGELASQAGVAPSTATEHLHRLVQGGLLVERKQGRHRYVQLADPAAAQLIEDLAARLEPRPDKVVTSLRAATVSEALKRGRTCYDHLAGQLGVAVTDAMTARGMLDQDGGFAVTPYGKEWLVERLEVDLRSRSRPLARGCLDWTERRQHLAGLAGAKLCETFLERRWVTRIGSGRAVRVTRDGRGALHSLLGLEGLG